MLSVNDLRQGVLFKHEEKVYQVLEFQRHKQARSKGVVNVKVKDVEFGGVREITFNSAAVVEEADAASVSLDFIFNDTRKGKVVFSEPSSKKRLEIDSSTLGEEQLGYLVSGVKVSALLSSDDIANAKIYSISLPNVVDLKVVDAPPAERGNTASGGGKPVKLETGITITTPFFIENGDVIRVNTVSGTYIERV
ncbi:hypothetical protein HGA91_02770 [candidate division WWE3 bacterium]|nr:hypothetical protein [candidate division WWE3 bacterium]